MPPQCFISSPDGRSADDRYFAAGATPAAHKTFETWFPGLPLVYKDANGYALRVNQTDAGILTEIAGPDAAAGAGGRRPLVCFRAVTLGVAGWTMMRGAAYAFHPARTFPDAQLEGWHGVYVSAHAEFVDFLLGSYGLPLRAAAAAAAAASDARMGDVVVLNRRDGKRELRNVDALVEGLRQSVGGRAVREVRLDALPLRDQAAAMQGADLVLGVHSAGSINVM